MGWFDGRSSSPPRVSSRRAHGGKEHNERSAPFENAGRGAVALQRGVFCWSARVARGIPQSAISCAVVRSAKRSRVESERYGLN